MLNFVTFYLPILCDAALKAKIHSVLFASIRVNAITLQTAIKSNNIFTIKDTTIFL